MWQNLAKNFLPHIVAVVVFIVVSNMFLSMVNKDYGLKQGDIEKVMGMSKELRDYRFVNEQEALWTNNMFCGMPGYQINMYFASNWVSRFDRMIKFNMDPAIGAIYMCMLGFYVLLMCLRVNPWLAIAISISFGLSTINLMYLGGGHTSKVNAISYMAPVLGGMLLALRGKALLGSAVFALFLALHLASNHFQMTYYLMFLLGCVGVAEVVRALMKKEIKSVLIGGGLLMAGGILAVLPNAGNLMLTNEYSKYTTRGETDLTIQPENDRFTQAKSGLDPDYIVMYNMGMGDLWAMMIPNAQGGISMRGEAMYPLAENKEAMQQIPKDTREAMKSFPQYWGTQAITTGAFYFGAGMMLLFLLGIIFSKDILRWPFLVLFILCAALSLKSTEGLNGFFIHNFPLYNKFRDTKMILVLVQLMVPALAAVFLNELIHKNYHKRFLMALSTGVVAIMVVVIALSVNPAMLGSMITERESESMEQYKNDKDARQRDFIFEVENSIVEAREFVFRKDANRTLMIVFLVGGLAVLIYSKKVNPHWVIPVIMVVVAADMWSVSRRYMNDEKNRDAEGNLDYIYYSRNDDRWFPFSASVADEFILNKERVDVKDFDAQRDKLIAAMKSTPYMGGLKTDRIETAAKYGALQLGSNYRVLRLQALDSDAGTAYFHKTLGGYHAAKLKRYQQLVDFYLSDQLQAVAGSFKGGRSQVDSVLKSVQVVNMLNAKYVIFNPSSPPVDNSANAFGNAWFADSVAWAQNSDEEMLGLGKYDLKHVAIVHDEFKAVCHGAIPCDSSASVKMTDYATKKIQYHSSNANEGLVVFSEIYYPAGWKCRIDGNEVESFRSNYVLRAVNVPAGEHDIEWSFEPEIYEQTNLVNYAGSISLLGFSLSVIIAAAVSAFRRPKSV